MANTKKPFRLMISLGVLMFQFYFYLHQFNSLKGENLEHCQRSTILRHVKCYITLCFNFGLFFHPLPTSTYKHRQEAMLN